MFSFKEYSLLESLPSDLFNDVILNVLGSDGLNGVEFDPNDGSTLVLSFDSDEDAELAFDKIDAFEPEYYETDLDDGTDVDIENDDESDSRLKDDSDSSGDDVNEINEAKIIVKVNSKGKKRRRVKCKPGFKLSSSGTSCVPITGKEKAAKRIAIKKAVRTKKAKGSSFQNKVNRKTKIAKRKRKGFGL